MKWLTRSHVHVDRVACPWLITRFVDNDAEFLFVPKSQVDRVASETGAIPFDAPGVELGHHDGRCSFESIMLKYDLKNAALVRMAKIVHSADSRDDIDKDPLARGLEAIATGYSPWRRWRTRTTRAGGRRWGGIPPQQWWVGSWPRLREVR